MNEILLSAGCLMLAASVVMQELQIRDLRKEQARVSGKTKGLRSLVKRLDQQLADNSFKLNDKVNRHVYLRTNDGYVSVYAVIGYHGPGNDRPYIMPSIFGKSQTNDRSDARPLLPSEVKQYAKALGVDHYITEPVEADHD